MKEITWPFICGISLLVITLSIIGFIVGCIYWIQSIPQITIIDLNKINTYGIIYPQCNNYPFVNYSFVTYSTFNCHDKCSVFCVKYRGINDNYTDLILDETLLTNNSIGCIIIKVQALYNQTNQTNITFQQCYNNIKWSIIEKNIRNPGEFDAWITIVIVFSIVFFIVFVIIIFFNLTYNCTIKENKKIDDSIIHKTTIKNKISLNIKNNLKEDNQCSICMKEIIKNETIYNFPCEHDFHRNCVKSWIIEHNSCPNCRRIIFPFSIDDYIII